MATNKLKIGTPIPEFSLPAVDGKTYSINSFEDKELLCVIFSCNHCPYVQAYENRIIDLQKKFKDKLQIVAISSNDAVTYPEDSFEEMKKRAVKKNFNFPYLYDESQKTARDFDATHTPEIFLFNKERKLCFHGKIDDYWQDENKAQNHYLLNALNELLAGEEVSVPETYTIGCTIKWK